MRRLPPKGDPRRPLHQAVSSTRTLGVLLIGLSICAVAPVLRRGGLPLMPTPLLYFGGFLLAYLVPGVLYLLVAINLRRRKFWAVVTGVCVVSMQSLMIVFGLAAFALAVEMGSWNVFVLIPAGFLLLILVAMIQLLVQLIRSFEAIKYPPFEQEEGRGFEPIVGQFAANRGTVETGSDSTSHDPRGG